MGELCNEYLSSMKPNTNCVYIVVLIGKKRTSYEMSKYIAPQICQNHPHDNVPK
jgi:hypothetical protein